MKNTTKLQVIVIALCSLLQGFNLQAQAPEAPTSKHQISIEIDPATFAFGGYGLHIRLQPKVHQHLLVGLGTYAMDLPDLLVDFNPKNRAQDWNVRLNQGYGLFAEHHFYKVNEKWFVGTQVGIQEYKIGNDQLPSTSKFTNVLVMGTGGYTWKPFDFGLYIKPWAGIGYTSQIAGTNTVENRGYDIAPITMFATLHLGYTF